MALQRRAFGAGAKPPCAAAICGSLGPRNAPGNPTRFLPRLGVRRLRPCPGLAAGSANGSIEGSEGATPAAVGWRARTVGGEAAEPVPLVRVLPGAPRGYVPWVLLALASISLALASSTREDDTDL